MSAWKSRWSWVRLVNTATAKRTPSVRLQRQRVRGDLHRAGRVAGVEHAAEGRLQVDRLRRRPLDLLLDPADDLLHRPQQPGLDPRGLEDVPDQEGGGRLAVGAGDPGDPQLRGRVAQKRAAIGAIAARASATRTWVTPRSRCRSTTSAAAAASTARARELVPVRALPGNAEEQRAGLDRATVVGEAGRPRRRASPTISATSAPASSSRSFIAAILGRRGRDSGLVRRAISRYGSANLAISPNAGAATVPP